MNIRERLAVIEQKVTSIDEKYDRLMNLLTPRIEKWDKSSTQSAILMKIFIIGGGGTVVAVLIKEALKGG